MSFIKRFHILLIFCIIGFMGIVLISTTKTKAESKPAIENIKSQSSDNLLQNPNFDSALAHWTPEGNVTIIPGHNGGNAIKSVQTWSTEGPAFWHGIAQKNIAVMPNQNYLFKAWYQFDNATSAHLKVQWFDNRGEQISVNDTQDTYWSQTIPDGWQQRTKVWLSPPNAATVSIIILHGVTYDSGVAKNVTGSTLNIDDVFFGFVENTPTPTPLSTFTPMPTVPSFNCTMVSDIPRSECDILVTLELFPIKRGKDSKVRQRQQ